MSAPISTKIGHALARVLQIDLNPGQRAKESPIPRVIEAQDGSGLGTTYIEQEPTVMEWFQQFEPSVPGFVSYLLSLIPFISWIGRYNLKWLYGDLVAGITVGCVVIPQGSKFRRPSLLLILSTSLKPYVLRSPPPLFLFLVGLEQLYTLATLFGVN